MRIKKGKNGYIKKSFTYNGKRYYIYGKTAEEVYEKMHHKKNELENNYQDFVNPTLMDYYLYFTDIRRKELKESTIRAQKYQFENIANVKIVNDQLFGDLRIKDITRKDIEQVRQILLEQGKTPQNLNTCFAHLNHVFNNAVLDETIIKNPCKALKPLKRKTEPISENKHRALSEEETKIFFDAARERNSFYIGVFLFMLNSGMRIGEVSALNIFDIDRKKGFIHVNKTVSRKESGSYYIQDAAKTISGKRDIPLTTELLNIIKDQEQLNRTIFGIDNNPVLFRSSENNLLREYTVNREIKRICKAAHIEYFTCHAFRNTFATRFIEQRPQDYKILSEILGHKDISITLNLYTHVMSDNKIRAMQNIQIKTS